MRATVESRADGKRFWNLPILCAVLTLAMSITSFAPTVSGLSWSTPVVITSGESWSDPQIEEGMNGVYVLSYVYPYDRVNLFTNNNNGSSWVSLGDPLGGAGFDIRKYPGMCLYDDGVEDVVLVTSGDGYVVKSTDSGRSFGLLTHLPLTYDSFAWDYPNIATNASWFGRNPDHDIYAVGSVLLDTGRLVVSFSKSLNDGASWGPQTRLTTGDHHSTFPYIVSDGSKLFVFYSRISNDDTKYLGVYMRTSADWGTTWTPETLLLPVVIKGNFVRSVQNLGGGKAMMLWIDCPAERENTLASYGYFWYSNTTYEEVGNFTGADWGLGIEGIGATLSRTGTFRNVWINSLDATTTLRYTDSIDSGLAVKAPLLSGSPPALGQLGVTYSLTAHTSDPDSGNTSLVLQTNAPWLNITSTSANEITVSGTPSAVGTFWAKLKISDADSADIIKWTFTIVGTFPPQTVTKQSGLSWSSKVSWEFAVENNVTMRLRCENQGLTSLAISVYDVTSYTPKIVCQTRVVFTAPSSYPSGTAFTVWMALQTDRTYMVAVLPMGAVGRSAMVVGEYGPP